MHRSHLTLQPDGTGYLEVCEAIHLSLPQQRLVQRIDIQFLQMFINVNNMLQFI